MKVQTTICVLWSIVIMFGMSCMQYQREEVYIHTNPVRVEYNTDISYKGFLCDYLGTRIRIDTSRKQYFIVDEHGNKQEVVFKR